MTSTGLNVGSSSGASSRGGPPSCTWVSLSLEEQLTNFKHIIGEVRFGEEILEARYFKYVVKVVKELRVDPWVDIESLLPRGQFEDTTLNGSTPLHWAIWMDDRTMVHYILTSGRVDINAQTRYREETALRWAAYGGNHDMMKDLLEYKVDVSICNNKGISPLQGMVQHKDSMFGILKTILANNVNICDKRKRTVLHNVAWGGATNVVAYLLEQKADVNMCDECGCTPLHRAVGKGSLDVVTLLCEQGANINQVDNRKESPLFWATKNGNWNIASFLLEHNANAATLNIDGKSPLLHSLKEGKADISSKLIAANANIHFMDTWKNNTLHLAIQGHDKEQNMTDIVKLLRERGVDANAKNDAGYSPFFAVVVEGHTEVVRELLKSKEKINLMQECNGQTAIQIAFDYDHEHIKRALLECDDVSRYVNALYRDRQVYVDATNAILVGAALIASVTFVSWLQPPLGYTTSYPDLAPSTSNINYVDVQDNLPLRAFWVFNTL